MSTIGDIGSQVQLPIGTFTIARPPRMTLAQIAGTEPVNTDIMWIKKNDTNDTYWFKAAAGVTEFRPVGDSSTLDPENPPSSIFKPKVLIDPLLTQGLSEEVTTDLEFSLSALWNLHKHASTQR